MGVLSSIIVAVLNVLELAILIRVILSWIPIPEDKEILVKAVKIIHQITEPVLAPVRNLIDKLSNGRSMMIDISPLIVFFLIGMLQRYFSSFL